MSAVISPRKRHGHVRTQYFHAEVDLTIGPGDHHHQILNNQAHYFSLSSAQVWQTKKLKWQKILVSFMQKLQPQFGTGRLPCLQVSAK